MGYVVGAFAGILYGGLVGVCKYFFLWGRLLSSKKNVEITMKKMYLRIFISYAINITTLFIAYFARNLLPFDFVAFVIATAVSLSVAGKVFSLQKVSKKVEII